MHSEKRSRGIDRMGRVRGPPNPLSQNDPVPSKRTHSLEPSCQKTIRFLEAGTVDVLQIKDRPFEQPGTGEVRLTILKY